MPDKQEIEQKLKSRQFCPRCLGFFWGVQHVCPLDNDKEVIENEN